MNTWNWKPCHSFSSLVFSINWKVHKRYKTFTQSVTGARGSERIKSVSALFYILGQVVNSLKINAKMISWSHLIRVLFSFYQCQPCLSNAVRTQIANCQDVFRPKAHFRCLVLLSFPDWEGDFVWCRCLYRCYSPWNNDDNTTTTADSENSNNNRNKSHVTKRL